MSLDYDSNMPLAGARATETAHRKIELQSPADLTYLIANVSRAAREKIDRHLPPDAAPEGEEDAMKRRVEVLVDDVSELLLLLRFLNGEKRADDVFAKIYLKCGVSFLSLFFLFVAFLVMEKLTGEGLF